MKTLILILILLPVWTLGQRNTRLPKTDYEFYRKHHYRNVCVYNEPKVQWHKEKLSKPIKRQNKGDYRLLRTKQNHCKDKVDVNRMKIRAQSNRWWPNHS